MHTKKLVILVMLLLLFVTLCSCSTEVNSFKPSDSVKVYLNSPLDFDKPSERTDSNVGKALIELINSANDTIDFAIYGLRNQKDVLDALIDAQSRGVIIRGVVDMDINNENYYDDTDDLIATFTNIVTDYDTDIKTLNQKKNSTSKPYWSVPKGYNGPPQCIGYSLKNDKAIIAVHASKENFEFKGDIMHNKFFIVDGSKVWTGSTNVSGTGTGGYNANVACVIENETVAYWYTNEFNQMYENNQFHLDKSSTGKPKQLTLDNNTGISCYFSPQDSTVTGALLPLIRNAKNNINIAIFYLTHNEITSELIKAFNRGVEVRIILDATAATNGYTKHEILRAVGIPVKVENWGGKMHMKAATFDNEYLVLGSMNWTSAGDNTNDENTIIINNPYYANQLNQLFVDMWSNIPKKYLQVNPAPESEDSINSLIDGIDNDYDYLVDMQDNPKPEKIKLPPYKIVPKTDGYELIKGIINKNGYKIYILPNDKYYHEYKVNEVGEGYFPSIKEAKESGFEAFNYKKHILNK